MATTPRILNVNLDVLNPKQALIVSSANKASVSSLVNTLGDQQATSVYMYSTNPATGLFGLDPNSGSASYSLKVGLGTPGGVPAQGTFTLTFSGQTTAPLAYNITAAALQTALQALSSIGASNCLVTGAFPTWDVQFVAGLGGAAQPLMTSNGIGLYPTSDVLIANEQTGGVAGSNSIQSIELAQRPVVLQSSWSAITQVTPNGNPTGGTYTLTFGGQTTSALAYNAIASVIQAALVALTTIGTGNVSVSGTFPNYSITFINSMGATPQQLITATSSLTPTSQIVIATTQNGGGAYNAIQTMTLQTTTTQNIGWNAILNFTTAPLVELFTQSGTSPLPQINTTLEIQLIDGSGNVQTVASYPVTIYHRVIDAASIAASVPPNAVVSFYTIPNGVNNGTVALSLAAAPRMVGVLGVAQGTGHLIIHWLPVLSSISTSGFNFQLSGTTDTADYQLQYMLVF